MWSVTMKPWLVATLLTLLAASQADDQFLEYDSVAIKRFEDALRGLKVSPPGVTVVETPIKRPIPRVNSPAGEFEGHWIKSQYGRPIAAFEGIPYAQPPVGPLRFKLAQPLNRLPKPFKAVKRGSSCTQMSGNNIHGQEDCLYINIFVPEKVQRSQSELLPVIFNVHGGGFVGGDGGMSPAMFLEKDVVLVTLNYRLGPLGFLTTEDNVIPANLGLKDQVAALQWVAKNIASFGGNPKLVTVNGVSAGGASTEFLMLSPLTKGLIHRAISMSGSAYCPWALSFPGQMRENVDKAVKLINCSAANSTELLACLQTKSAAEITQLNERIAAWRQKVARNFKIVVEGNVPGAVIPEHPSKLFAKRINDVPLMTGTVSEEGSFYGMIDLFNHAADLKKLDESFVALIPRILNLGGPTQTSIRTLETIRKAYFGPGPFNKTQGLLATRLAGDINFNWPSINSVQSHLKGAKSPVYVYHFNYKGSNNINADEIFDAPRGHGVNHAADQAFLSPLPNPANPLDARMALVYTDLVTNFARDGVPTSSLLNVTWTPVSPGKQDMDYLYIYSPLSIRMKKNLYPERWSLLKALFEGKTT